MPSPRHQLLDLAVDMSHRMVRLGRDGDWDAVIELEPRRREHLQEAFATRETVDAQLAHKVRRILELDRELLDLSHAARGALAGELSQTSRGRRVANAYHSVAR
jgi:hypothetical protein